MSKPCARLSDEATCGHKVTPGSPSVFINGLNAARVGVDKAGGVIVGPGAVGTFVNGVPQSLINDKVAGHGEPPHSPSPQIKTASPNVFAA